MAILSGSRRFRLPLLLAAVYLTAGFVLRLLLWRSFGTASGVGLPLLPGVLITGAVNDGVALLYLLFPLSLYLLLLPRRWATRPWQHRLFALGTFLVFFGLFYLAASEYFFFEEFDSRFNLVAVDYLIYPHEVLVNIWDSYPVVRVILGCLLLAAFLLRGVWPKLRGAFADPSPLRRRLPAFALHGLLLSLALTLVSADTLAWSRNRVANELSANGLCTLFNAFRTNELDYQAHYRTIDRSEAFRLMREELAGGGGTLDPEASLSRDFSANPSGLGKLNVVVVVEESLGAGFVGAYGDTRNLTPHLDRLSEKGLLFRNAYATGTRTVRGLEAITTSFPPIPSESILKRPGSEGIANWGEVMRSAGYHTSFLYGGYGYFDNMNHFYQSNGFAISDRSDIPDPAFANIWGVSDQDLFERALGYFDALEAKGRPFFSILMTTSNHKPYTFPEGIAGIPAEGGGRSAGIRYADHALGGFLQQAADHPWFADTLFVIVADHDARVYGRAQIPLHHYRIPLLVYAPDLVRPGAVETAISQIDIAPTVLGLLGLPYKAPFYGQDVLHLPPGLPRPIPVSHNHDVALVEGNEVAVLGLGRSADTYRYDEQQDRMEPLENDGRLIDLATAYYQSAFDLFQTHRYR